MAVTANRQIITTYSGDVVGTETASAATNAASVGSVLLVNLASGFNSVAVPTGSGAVGVTIVPPAGNTQTLTLKGVTGDTGVLLHKTDPTSLAIDSSVTAIGITAGASITGVRFFWT